MNELTISDLYEMFAKGDVEQSYDIIFSSEMIDNYATLYSTPISPLHTDDQYAVEFVFKARIVPQLLIVSQFLPLIEYYLPGKYGLGLGANDLKFRKPVYVGDKLTINGKLTRVSLATKMIILKITVVNQDGLLISDCSWKAKLLK
ncbi:MAG: hypothetical protein LBN42_01740 [Oscillospiraceae bacterium]|jgi:acyl dehydratase|nr:hypothetical protein [Oscillospiraceae bacterium]